MTNGTPNMFETELRRELKRILAKTMLLRAIAGLLTFVAVAAWVFLAVVLLSTLTGAPGVSSAVVFSRTVVVLLIVLFAVLVIYPVLRTPSLKKLSFDLERRRDFQDLVAAGYEFSRDASASSRYSPDLIREVIRQAVGSIKGLEIRFLFLDRKQLAFIPLAYAALVILTVLALVSPSTILTAGKRITAPREIAAVEHEANLFCSPGDVTVISGSDVEIVARDFGGSEDPVTASYDLAEGFWKTEPTVEREVTDNDGAATNEHVYTFRDIRGTVSYHFERGGKKTSTYTITVVNKPVVTDLTLVMTPPSYTGEAPDTLVDAGGSVHALEGTRVAIDGKSNNILDKAWVQFDDGDKKLIPVDGRNFDLEFTALRDGAYGIIMTDSLGHETDEPLIYSIDVYEDHPPVLDVLEPGTDSMLPRNLKVNLGFTAADDYGVNRAAVYYRKSGHKKFSGTRIPLGPHAGKRELVVVYEWSLDGVDLFPGDYLEYFVQIEDNNVVTGPGVAKSRVFHISVPTMAELYRSVEEESVKRTDLVQEAIKEGRELKERIEKIAREMKKTDEVDWSQQKEIDKAVASQEKIQEKLEEMHKSLDDTLESLSENRMTSQEIGEKMEEINRLIEEINSEELNKYIEEMQKAMEKLDPEEIQKALENLNMSAEDMLRSLERTESLLKEIQREQAVEEAIRKTRDLMEAQEKLSDETADADDENNMDGLSQEQEELAERADELEKELEELANKMQDQELADKMQEASQKNSMSQTSKEMKEASSQLQQGQKSQAMSHQEKAEENMISLFKSLANIQMQMQSASNRKVSMNLQRLADSTLEISFKQEELSHALREQIAAQDGVDRSMIRSLAEEQQSYAHAIEQIADELHEISKVTLVVPDALLEALGRCMQSMESSLLFLEQAKPFMSTTSATQATTTLNEITIDLLRACKNCSGGGSGQSEGSPMMQRLLSGQQQVLRETEHMLAMRAGQEKMMQQMQAEVERLGGQQRSMKELAEQIRDDLKREETPLGRMDRIIDEMDEIIRDIESGALDQSTLEKEERILSRLLDAQRSIHSRDYEKKRTSETAGEMYSDASVLSASRQQSQMLREEIRRAMALKAPGEFEDLIRLYFRALAEEATTGRSGE